MHCWMECHLEKFVCTFSNKYLCILVPWLLYIQNFQTTPDLLWLVHCLCPGTCRITWTTCLPVHGNRETPPRFLCRCHRHPPRRVSCRFRRAGTFSILLFFFFMSVLQASFSQSRLQLPACWKVFFTFVIFLTCCAVNWTKYRQHLLHNVYSNPPPPPPPPPPPQQPNKQKMLIHDINCTQKI